ncbi:hypothetical protein Mapa_010749 [Marchantia paleacea]|nr:hypothetical protein Mapa_010749 [Marchantia paleacea]
MECSTAREFTCSHGLRRALIVIALWSFLLQPSMAVKTYSSLPSLLENEDPNEIAQMIAAIENDMPNLIQDDEQYGTGVVATADFVFSTGLRMVFRLISWSFDTCNLGYGSERFHLIVTNPGSFFINALTTTLLPSMNELLYAEAGQGIVVDEAVTLDFFPDLDYEASNPSDDDPNDHEMDDNEGEEEEAEGSVLVQGSPIAKSYRSVNAASQLHGTFRANHSRPLDSNSSASNGTTPPMGSSDSRDHNLFSGRNLSAGHVANLSRAGSLGLGHRKFPVDPFGDCDLPSLVLMTARSAFVNEQDVHGLPVLNPTDKIWSPNTRFYLVMQIDCNLVLYDVVANIPLWASHTNGRGVSCYAAVTMDGCLAVFDGNSNELFRTKTKCLGKDTGGVCWTNTILQVQDDGNLVLYIFNTLYVLFASNTVQCDGGCRP